MALASEEKLSLLERCMNGTPKIQLDLNRINRLASLGLGLPRRVPCNDHGQGSSPLDDTDSKKDSPPSKEEGAAWGQGLVVAGKNILPPVDSTEARKRKADRDAPSCRERTQARQTEGRPLSSNFILGADVRNRKAIESAKELLGFQDKENINPRCDYRRREPKKQVPDRSAEKRRLQVSNKLQNAPSGRKIGSLLIKQPVKPRIRAPPGDAPLPSLLSQDGLMAKEHLQQVSITDYMASSSADEPMSCVRVDHQAENQMLTQTDSMRVLQPLQLASLPICQSDDVHTNREREGSLSEAPTKQAGSKPSVLVANYSELRDLRASSLLVDSNQRGVVLASVKELSSSMNNLALADSSHCYDDMQPPSVPENAELKRETVQSNKNVHGSFILDAKHYVPSVQVGTSVSLPVTSIPSATACSITIRTASAPLATSFTEENVQPLSPRNMQPLRKHSPSLANGILKPSQGSHVSIASQEQAILVKREERHSPAKVTFAENEVMKEGQERASQDDIPMSDVGAAKLIQHLHLPEKKAINAGDGNLQLKKQGENDYYVWVNGRKYQKLKKIGRGGSSEVYKVIDRDGNIYALKRIKLKGRDYATACGFYQEIELLTRLHGKSYIIRLIDYEVTDKKLFSDKIENSHIIRHDANIYMVLEYGEVDLATMLQDKLKEKSQGGNNIDETWLRFYWRQIIEAVNTVHEERIMHADLKPANFLLVKGVLKLIDFGIAKSIQGDTTNIERDAQVGTLNYMSPEAFLMNEKDEHGNVIKCGRSSDIWALGCILYQMVYGKTPFAHITTLHAKIQEVANPKHKINFPPVLNPHLLDVMKKCLAYNREDRLRIPELINHPFLQPQLAQPVYSKKVEEEILLQIQAEEEQGRDATALIRLLEKVRLLDTSMDV